MAIVALRERTTPVFSAKLAVAENDPVRDLDKDSFSAKPETVDRVSTRVREKAFFSTKLADDPIESVRITVRPLRNELSIPRESDCVLKYEAVLVEPEADPIDEVKLTE